MADVAFGHLDDAQTAAPNEDAGIVAAGEVDSRPVIRGDDRPLRLWRHQLEPGASLAWEQPPHAGQCVYVWEGSLETDGALLASGGTVFVERHGHARLHAGPQGATLLHFQDAREQLGSERPGGQVHVIPEEGRVQAGERSREVYLDSTCPTCALWLHKTNFPTPVPAGRPHYHTTDEIIVVVRGEMRLGHRTLTPGGAIAINAQTQYSFGSGDDGICFINFRAAESSVFTMDENGAWNPPRLEVRDML